MVRFARLTNYYYINATPVPTEWQECSTWNNGEKLNDNRELAQKKRTIRMKKTEEGSAKIAEEVQKLHDKKLKKTGT